MRITFILLFGILFGSILTAQTNSKMKIFNSSDRIVGFDIHEYRRFNLTCQEFNIADSIAEIYVEKYSSEHIIDGKPINNYQDYYKQVFGLIDDKNEKIVFINCFYSADLHDYWKERIVAVRGGGSQYFNLKIKLNSKKAFDFYVNAPK